MNPAPYKRNPAALKSQNETVSDTAFAILPEYFFYLLSEQERKRRLDVFKSALKGELAEDALLYAYQILDGTPAFKKAV